MTPTSGSFVPRATELVPTLVSIAKPASDSESGPGRSPLPVVFLAPGEHAPGSGAQVLHLEAYRLGRAKDDKSAYGRYSMSDVHFHPTNYAHQGISFHEALEHMERLGIYRTVMSPIPTRQLVKDGTGVYRPAKGRASCGCNYYIPDPRIRGSLDVSADDYRRIVSESPPLAYDTECDTHTAAGFAQLTPAEKNRFDCMVTGLILGDERCSESLLRKLSNHPGVFTGVGEITIHKEFVQDKLDTRVQADLRPHKEFPGARPPDADLRRHWHAHGHPLRCGRGACFQEEGGARGVLRARVGAFFPAGMPQYDHHLGARGRRRKVLAPA